MEEVTLKKILKIIEKVENTSIPCTENGFELLRALLRCKLTVCDRLKEITKGENDSGLYFGECPADSIKIGDKK